MTHFFLFYLCFIYVYNLLKIKKANLNKNNQFKYSYVLH